jgi:hypothetical protein
MPPLIRGIGDADGRRMIVTVAAGPANAAAATAVRWLPLILVGFTIGTFAFEYPTGTTVPFEKSIDALLPAHPHQPSVSSSQSNMRANDTRLAPT